MEAEECLIEKTSKIYEFSHRNWLKKAHRNTFLLNLICIHLIMLNLITIQANYYWYSYKLINITMILKLLSLLLLFSLTHAQIQTPTSLSASPSPPPTPNITDCVSYQQGNCVSCPYNYHITQNQCYLNITNCQTYTLTNLGTENCAQCDSGSRSDGKGGCSANVLQLTKVDSSTSNIQSIDKQYGSSLFRVIPLSVAFSDPFFNLCNRQMITGQYGHFISQIPQPVYGVSFYAEGGLNQYKILYISGGQDFMMSIISINTQTTFIKLQSFVAIPSTYVIDNCAQYTTSLQCMACVPGYHFENNICYANIPGCSSYFRNICLQCLGYAILIENRCVSCSEMGDLGKLIFFGELFSFISSKTFPTFSQNYLLAN